MTRTVPPRLRALQLALTAFALGCTVHLFYYSLTLEGGLTLFTQQVLNSLTMGGIYALIAVGYTMVYGIIQLINFAHGEIYMMGAFLGITFIGMGVPFLPAMILAMAGCALIGMTIDQIAYRPLRQAPRLAALITAIGMSLFLQNLAMMIWGAAVYPFPDLKPEYTITVTGPTWSVEQLRESIVAPFEQNMGRVRQRQFEGVPFLKGWENTKKNLDDAEAAHAALPPDIPPADRQKALQEIRTLRQRFKELDGAIPFIKGWEAGQPAASADGATVTIYIRFRVGSKENGTQGLLTDWRNWARLQRPEGVNRANRAEINFEKATHVFQKDMVAWLWVSSDDKPAPGPRVQIPVKVLFILAASFLLMLFLNTIVQYTRIGKAMRACAQDKTTAALMGVNVNRVIVATFMLGSAMAAVAGILYGLYLGSAVFFRMGYFAGVLAFAAAVLGGIGNLKGAMLGGLLLGFVQGISKAYVTDWMTHWLVRIGQRFHIAQYFPDWDGPLSQQYIVNASYDYALAFSILILVILIRPTGLLGKPPADRA